MSIINGLITKDLLQLKNYRKTLIVFILIFVFAGLAQETTKGVGFMITVMLILGFGMFGMATFNYDEQSKADGYILTFPVTKKEILLSKYILIIGSTIIGAIVGIIASYIIVFIINKQLPNIQDYINVALAGILGVGLIEAIQIPCVYKWGAEKGRIQMFIVAAIIILLAGGLFAVAQNSIINLATANILNIMNNFLPLILILATIIIYYISYKVSYRIYKKKEE